MCKEAQTRKRCWPGSDRYIANVHTRNTMAREGAVRGSYRVFSISDCALLTNPIPISSHNPLNVI